MYASLILLIIIFVSFGCKSDTILLTAPIDPGDDVSFSADVNPIFQASCSGSGCHIGQTTNGVNLSSYDSVINSIAASYNKDAVIPSDAAGSPLVDKLGVSPEFGSRMPSGRAALSTLQIDTIRGWIDDGAIDN